MVQSANYPTPDEYRNHNGHSEYDMAYPRDSRSKSQYDPRQDPHGRKKNTYIIVVEEQDNIYDPDQATNVFEDRARRALFARKILGVVGCQLLCCTIFIIICLFIEPVNHFFHRIEGLILASLCSFIFCVLHIAIACCGVGRGKPNACNITLLIITTLTLTVFAAEIVIKYEILPIIIAAATTIGVVTFFLALTCLTKIDITDKIMYILGAFFAVLLFSLIAAILGFTGVISAEKMSIIKVIICAIFAVIYAILILYELNLICGGGKYAYEEDDWLVASVMLFTSIIFFFLKVLELAGDRR